MTKSLIAAVVILLSLCGGAGSLAAAGAAAAEQNAGTSPMPAASPTGALSPAPAPRASPSPSATSSSTAGNRCVTTRVQLDDPVSSANARPGDVFHFTVLDPIQLSSGTTVPAGAPGVGVVVVAQHAQRGGRGGSLALDPRSIALRDGRDVHVLVDPSGAALNRTGRSNNVPGPLGFIPGVGVALGAYGTLHHGSDVTVLKGTIFTVFVGDETATSACVTHRP